MGGFGSCGRGSRWVWWLALGLVLGSPGALRAQEIPGYPQNIDAFDRREVALLPQYCTYTQLFRGSVPGGSNPQMIDAWSARMGPVFNHMHHYCFGLMNTHRALYLSRDATTRSFYLNAAVREYDYVISRTTEAFVMLPEIFSKKGEALGHLGRGPLAVFEYERAIELKPDYWPPYAHLADHYKGLGDLKKAREVLEAGLTKAPDAKALQRRLAELNAAGRSVAR